MHRTPKRKWTVYVDKGLHKQVEEARPPQATPGTQWRNQIIEEALHMWLESWQAGERLKVVDEPTWRGIL